MDHDSAADHVASERYEPPAVLASVSQLDVGEMVPDDLSPHVHTSVSS